MASSGSKSKGRKGKLGKNKHRIVAYYMSNRYEMNRIKKLRKHVTRYGKGDKPAMTAIGVLKAGLPLHLSKTIDI